MDLAVTRFSGKKLPAIPKEAKISDKEAYSHVCTSFGFWLGDDNLQEPAFYSYTFPSTAEINKEVLKPGKAQWVLNNGNHMAVLKYSDLKNEKDPGKALLGFMESAYQAGARLAGWNKRT